MMCSPGRIRSARMQRSGRAAYDLPHPGTPGQGGRLPSFRCDRFQQLLNVTRQHGLGIHAIGYSLRFLPSSSASLNSSSDKMATSGSPALPWAGRKRSPSMYGVGFLRR